MGKGEFALLKMHCKPFNLQQLISTSPESLFGDVSSISEQDFYALTTQLEDLIAKDSNCIVQSEETWQLLFLCLAHAGRCSPELLSRFVEIIGLGLTSSIQFANSADCESVEKYAFSLLILFPNFIPLLAQRQQFSDSKFPQPLVVAAKVLQSIVELVKNHQKINQIYGPKSADKETLIRCLVKILNSFLEYGSGIPNSNGIKRLLCETYASFILHFSFCKQIFSSFLLQSFQCFEDSGELASSLLCFMMSELESDLFAVEFLRLFCNITENGINFSSELCVKNTTVFFANMTRNCPKFVLKMFGLCTAFFQQENYSLRNALLDCINSIIVDKKIESSQESTFKSLLNIVIERTQDINAYVRSKSLSILSSICIAGQLPAAVLSLVWKKSSERLCDKTSIVRKRALILLSDILKNHPFNFDGGELNEKYFQSKIARLDKIVEELEKPEPNLIQHKNAHASESASEQIDKLMIQKKYYSEAAEFSGFVSQVLESVADYFVFCPNKTEVNEAIEFISICHVLKVSGSQKILAKILPLVWSKDSTGDESNKRSIREHLLNSLSILLFEGSNSEQVACNLENFYEIFALKHSYQDCVEEIFVLFLEKKFINKQVFLNLWNHLSLPERRNNSIAVLCMCSDGIEATFGIEGRICKFLSHFSKKSTENNQNSNPFSSASFIHYFCKFIQNSFEQPASNPTILNFLNSVIVNKSADSSWLPAVECAINCVFIVDSDPLTAAEGIVKKLSFDLSRQNAHNSDNTASADSFLLGKFLFVLGHLSIKMSRYLHKVEAVLKKKLSVSQQNSVDALDEVVGKISIDESLLDLFGAIRDVDLLYNPNSIFYNFLILPVKLCEKLMANNEKENDFLLSMSCICLAKFMSVSERYCRQNLPLFIQLMTNCKDSKVRSNLVVSFGDFCTSYNHLVEPFVVHLFSLIENNSTNCNVNVRINALLIVSWLILNGMIKTKGQMHQIALCFLDSNRTIFQLSCSFFQDLALKDSNVIYNNIPDIVSNLSQNQNLDEKQFTQIIGRIFNLLRKEKQIDNIATKIIQRLVGCSNERISKYLVLCLIILNQATLNGAAEQRILSKIIEHWDTAFQDKIAEKYDNDTDQIIEDNEIKDLLNELISKAKKSESSHKLACQLENILNGNKMEIDSNSTNNDNLSENSKVVVKKGKKQPLPNENDPNFAQPRRTLRSNKH